MNIDFSLLLILLLPGFLGLWVYKQISVEDIDRRGEWTQVALGFCFGVLNLFVYSLTSKLLIRIFPLLKNDLSIPIKNQINGLMEIKFWGIYAFLVIIALINGMVVGLMQGWKILPTHFLPKIAGKILKKEVQTKDETGLGKLIDELKPRYTTVVRIYPLGYPGKALVGMFGGFSESEGQVLIQDECLFRQKVLDDQGNNWETFQTDLPSRTCVDFNKGIVVEFQNTPQNYQEEYRAWLMKKFNETQGGM